MNSQLAWMEDPTTTDSCRRYLRFKREGLMRQCLVLGFSQVTRKGLRLTPRDWRGKRWWMAWLVTRIPSLLLNPAFTLFQRCRP